MDEYELLPNGDGGRNGCTVHPNVFTRRSFTGKVAKQWDNEGADWDDLKLFGFLF